VTASVTVRHNFETAHRLPFLGGKCQNLHGHSWWAEVSVFGEPDVDGILLDFATLKSRLRGWIDDRLDHGTMLGAADPLVYYLRDEDCKVFVFDPEPPGSVCRAAAGPTSMRDLWWPTVENVAELLNRVTRALLVGAPIGAGADLGHLSVHVRVTETHVNEATAR